MLNQPLYNQSVIHNEENDSDIKIAEGWAALPTGHAVLHRSKLTSTKFYSGLDSADYKLMKKLKGAPFASRVKRHLERDPKYKETIVLNKRINRIVARVKLCSLSYLIDSYYHSFHSNFIKYLEKQKKSHDKSFKNVSLSNYLFHIFRETYEVARKERMPLKLLTELKNTLESVKHPLFSIKNELISGGVLQTKSFFEDKNLRKKAIISAATQIAFKVADFLPAGFTSNSLIAEFEFIIDRFNVTLKGSHYSAELVAVIAYLKVLNDHQLPSLISLISLFGFDDETSKGIYGKIYRIRGRNKEFKKFYSKLKLRLIDIEAYKQFISTKTSEDCQQKILNRNNVQKEGNRRTKSKAESRGLAKATLKFSRTRTELPTNSRIKQISNEKVSEHPAGRYGSEMSKVIEGITKINSTKNSLLDLTKMRHYFYPPVSSLYSQRSKYVNYLKKSQKPTPVNLSVA